MSLTMLKIENKFILILFNICYRFYKNKNLLLFQKSVISIKTKFIFYTILFWLIE